MLARLIIVLLTASLALAQPATQPVKPETPAQLAFENFKKLEGNWAGKSTRGWNDENTWKTIAGGTCVMHTSFDAHPNQTMLTVFHMDGEHLMLTHYCVAKNQPRMRATEISPDGKQITFTFVDSTNLKSRDQGHMDKAVYKFADDGSYTTQWTWYQNGTEKWMEEIRCERVKKS